MTNTLGEINRCCLFKSDIVKCKRGNKIFIDALLFIYGVQVFKTSYTTTVMVVKIMSGCTEQIICRLETKQ